MKKRQNSFDIFYNTSGNYFGGHSTALELFIESTGLSGGRALDIGAGEGRNSQYLSVKGFDVTAVEPSKQGAKAIIQSLQHKAYSIDVIDKDFLAVKDFGGRFDLIIAVTSLDHMEKEYLDKAVEKIDSLLNPGGYLFAVVFTKDDPGNTGDTANASECAGFIRHYFETNELKEMFNKYETMEYYEFKTADNSHGKPHIHCKAKLIARKN